jgi:hypothetical protein
MGKEEAVVMAAIVTVVTFILVHILTYSYLNYLVFVIEAGTTKT